MRFLHVINPELSRHLQSNGYNLIYQYPLKDKAVCVFEYENDKPLCFNTQDSKYKSQYWLSDELVLTF